MKVIFLWNHLLDGNEVKKIAVVPEKGGVLRNVVLDKEIRERVHKIWLKMGHKNLNDHVFPWKLRPEIGQSSISDK